MAVSKMSTTYTLLVRLLKKAFQKIFEKIRKETAEHSSADNVQQQQKIEKTMEKSCGSVASPRRKKKMMADQQNDRMNATEATM